MNYHSKGERCCLHPDDLCDGRVHCIHVQDDEDLCEQIIMSSRVLVYNRQFHAVQPYTCVSLSFLITICSVNNLQSFCSKILVCKGWNLSMHIFLRYITYYYTCIKTLLFCFLSVNEKVRYQCQLSNVSREAHYDISMQTASDFSS